MCHIYRTSTGRSRRAVLKGRTAEGSQSALPTSPTKPWQTLSQPASSMEPLLEKWTIWAWRPVVGRLRSRSIRPLPEADCCTVAQREDAVKCARALLVGERRDVEAFASCVEGLEQLLILLAVAERVVVADDRVAVELLAAEACNAGARPALAELQLQRDHILLTLGLLVLAQCAGIAGFSCVDVQRVASDGPAPGCCWRVLGLLDDGAPELELVT